jgi:hypothetical protein
MTWLAYEKRCVAVVCERNVRRCLGDPDILGVTGARHTLEIEIKVNMTDFRRNTLKRHVSRREDRLTLWPRHYWFLVPPEMVDTCAAELPEWAGLLTVDHLNVVRVIRSAPVNPKSKKLSLLECGKLLRCSTNHTIAAERSANQFRTYWKQGTDLYEPDFSI